MQKQKIKHPVNSAAAANSAPSPWKSSRFHPAVASRSGPPRTSVAFGLVFVCVSVAKPKKFPAGDLCSWCYVLQHTGRFWKTSLISLGKLSVPEGLA